MTEERDKALREFIDTRHEDEIKGLTKAQAFGAGLRAAWDHLWERLEIIAKTVEGLKDKRGAELQCKDETIRNRDEHISEQHYQLDIEQKVGERLQAELLAANEKILIMTEAAIHVIQLHHAELRDKDEHILRQAKELDEQCRTNVELRSELGSKDELIELLKQSRANGDVLAELVEKTDELQRTDEVMLRVIEIAGQQWAAPHKVVLMSEALQQALKGAQ